MKKKLHFGNNVYYLFSLVVCQSKNGARKIMWHRLRFITENKQPSFVEVTLIEKNVKQEMDWVTKNAKHCPIL